jgi:putative ABC transport system ATP-binding protein
MASRHGKPDYSVRLTDVHKYYESASIEVKALQDVTFELERGSFAAIVGPSGSGKSTLMNLLGTIDKPTKGEIYIDEIPTSRMGGDALAEFRNKKLGFIFQAFNLVNGLDAQKNVELPMLVNHMQREERKRRAEELLDRLGMSDRLRLKPTQLSGGQQQRVAVARALVNNPSLILADEPTGNLDSKSGAEVLKLFDEISSSGNVTIVMVTHNPDTTKHCDKIVYLKDGYIEKIVNRG